jgi:4-alpha-glucanotransferase
MELERSCGVLLHITSLPGKYGIGTMGEEAREFIDLLAANGITWWQILPTGPVSESMGYSPYSSLSCFAGNELFIDIDGLRENKWFSYRLPQISITEQHFVNFDSAGAYKFQVLENGWDNFLSNASQEDYAVFNSFCLEYGPRWLDDYALYRALSDKYGTFSWLDWDKKIITRDPEAINAAEDELEDKILFWKFCQYIFHTQWDELKKYAESKKIRIIGDIPIYMSMDSADSWISANILEIDCETMKPEFIAGVPPDYFSKTGQLWGNPVYRWHDEHGNLNEETYAWWLKRIKHALTLTDIIRIDHFRGFESFWSVKYGDETAEDGEWVPGPGKILFDRLTSDIGELPIIAEDLGDITPEVKELRDSLDLPGMKILLFAFDHNNRNEYLPHNITDKHCVVYTGTHDNDTANGWFYNPEMYENDREYVMEYLAMKEWSDFHIRIIREAMVTIADLVIIPAQDILGYSREFRMNTPGTTEKNWIWKLTKGALNSDIMGRIGRMAHIFSRAQEKPEEEQPDTSASTDI